MRYSCAEEYAKLDNYQTDYGKQCDMSEEQKYNEPSRYEDFTPTDILGIHNSQ